MAVASSTDRSSSVDFPRAWLLLLGAIALVLGWLYADGLVFVFRQFSEPEYSHGYLIPLITLFFLWNRREAVLAERSRGSWLGPGLVALGGLGFLVGELADIHRFAWLSLPLVLIGLGFAALGTWPMRRLWLPLAFLWMATPLPGSVHVLLSTDLQLISSQLGAGFLELLGIPVLLTGNIIDLGVYKLQVAEACNGLRYLFPLVAFAFLTAWLMRAPVWARVLVVASSVPLAILLNGLRIGLTGVFVDMGRVHLAEGFIHYFEGWLVFLVALSILFFEMYALCRLTGSRGGILDCLDFDRINGPPPRPRGVAPRGVPAPLAACLLALVAVGAGKLAVQDRAQLIPDRPPLAGFPLELQGWRGELDFVERWVVESLGASDQLLVDYTPPGGGPTVNLWIAYYGEQIRDAAIHSPKDCLPGGGWEYVDIRPVTAPVRRPDGETFRLNRGVIAKGEQTMLMYYWLDMRGRQITNELYQKFYNLWDSIVMRRSDGALIRLVTPVADDETVAAAEARLDAFLRVSYPHMVPHVAR